jgi:hypothetical protein
MLRSIPKVACLLAVFASGYFAGQFAPHLATPAVGQEETPASSEGGTALSEETKMKIKAAADAMNAAVEALKLDQAYTSATKGINTFGVLVGGFDSVKDLEDGRGVDPETFAALYAGLAADEIAEKVGRDPEGRVTYNGRLLRMYPVSRIRALYSARAAITGEDIAAELDGKKPAKKADAEAAPAEEAN